MVERSASLLVLYTVFLAVLAWFGGTVVRQALLASGTPAGRAGNIGGLVALVLFVLLATGAVVRALVAE